MITKIDIEKFGLFNNYRWSQNIGNDDNLASLKKVNLIYGRNYSGKTTLSRILRCVEKKQIHEKYLDGKFAITNDQGNLITQSNLNCTEKIRVYNTDFVKDNLSWLHDDLNGQLFISTHNLDFLKYLKRLTIPYDEKNKPLVNHFIVEKKKKDSESRCEIKLMPSYLRDYVTEYNFLFKEIYCMAKPFENGDRARFFENQFTHFYNLPNNMRKFLECYLFYRYPNTDNPLKNISKLFSGHIPSLVNRVINEYSHLTWGERGTLVMDVQEAESVAKDILNVIKTKDKEHFNALCNSIGADENIEF